MSLLVSLQWLCSSPGTCSLSWLSTLLGPTLPQSYRSWVAECTARPLSPRGARVCRAGGAGSARARAGAGGEPHL